MSKFRFRYSVRALLVVLSLAGIGAYWVALPSVNAFQFSRALNSHDYQIADSLFADEKRGSPAGWAGGGWEPNAQPMPLTFRQVWQGERWIRIEAVRGDRDGTHEIFAFNCLATRKGIRYEH